MAEAHDYDRFHALMKLADFRREYRETRRSIEWRVTLAVWALMVGLIVTVDKYPKWLVVIGAVAVVAAHFYWVNWNFERAEADASKMWGYHDAAMALVGGKEPKPPSPPDSIFKHPPALAAVAVTFILAIVSIVLGTLGSIPQTST